MKWSGICLTLSGIRRGEYLTRREQEVGDGAETRRGCESGRVGGPGGNETSQEERETKRAVVTVCTDSRDEILVWFVLEG